MSNQKIIQSALISVFHKDGLKPIVEELHKNNVTIYSTGGTENFIKELGIPVTPVEDVTSYPSILGGRVKTLHPKVFGGILNRQDHQGDIAEMKAYEIPQIDLVIVDFGASALTSIYLKKKIIFLELPNEYTYIKRLINTKAMDMEVRKSINK